jgi:hypothetical protein
MYRLSFSEVKQPGCGVNQPPPSSAEVKERIELYFIIRVMKSRRPRWAGHVACTGERRGAYRALVGKPEGR